MHVIEQAFEGAEAVAEATRKAAAGVAGKARAMAKAAREGNIGALRKAQADLDLACAALDGEVRTAGAAWPFAPQEEEAYLEAGYAEELRGAAEAAGVTLHERDGYLVAYPSMVRILPAERAVRVDRKRLRSIRPSFLAAQLLRNQRRTSGFAPARFLETLYLVYDELLREAGGDLAGSGGGRVLPLARIYKVLTALPGASRDYDRSDFARDIYTLDAKGPRETRRGFVVSFPASTGTRVRSADLFSFVDPAGENLEYYGVKFSDAG